MSINLINLNDKNDYFVKLFSIDLAKPAGTYSIATSIGQILVDDVHVYSVSAGEGFSSVAIQTDQSVPFVVMTALEGAVANISTEKNFSLSSIGKKFFLDTDQSITYTILGNGTGGSLYLVIKFNKIGGAGDLVHVSID